MAAVTVSLIVFNLLLCGSMVNCAFISSDPEKLINWCLDSQHHKETPSREKLTGEVSLAISQLCAAVAQ